MSEFERVARWAHERVASYVGQIEKLQKKPFRDLVSDRAIVQELELMVIEAYAKGRDSVPGTTSPKPESDKETSDE